MNMPDFDELAALAKTDPEELERVRRALVNQVIESAPDERLRRRLRGLQFKIDARIRLSRTPMAACLQLSRMMHDSLLELQASLAFRIDPATYGLRSEEGAPSTARIIPLDQARARRTQQARASG